MKHFELIFRNIVTLSFAVRAPFTKVIAFMRTRIRVFLSLLIFVHFLFQLHHLISFDLFNNISYFLREIIHPRIHLLLKCLIFSLMASRFAVRLLIFLRRTHTDQSCLERTIPTVDISLHPRPVCYFMSFELVYFLASLFLAHIVVIHEIHIILDTFTDGPSHKTPRFRSERHISLFFRRVKKSHRSFDSITEGDRIENNSASSCPFEIGYSKNAAIISENLCFRGHNFGEYSSFVVVSFPYFIIWPIQEDIFFH